MQLRPKIGSMLRYSTRTYAIALAVLNMSAKYANFIYEVMLMITQLMPFSDERLYDILEIFIVLYGNEAARVVQNCEFKGFNYFRFYFR